MRKVIILCLIFLLVSKHSTRLLAQKNSAHYYNAKADLFWHSNIDSAVIYAENAYQLSFKSSDWLEVSKAKANKGIASYIKGKYIEANLFYDTAIAIANSHNLPSARFAILKSYALTKQSFYKESITLLKGEIKNISTENSNYYLLKKALLSIYIELGRIPEAKIIIDEIDSSYKPTLFWSLNNGYLLLKSKYLKQVSNFKSSDSIGHQLLIHYDSTLNYLDKSDILLLLGDNAMQIGSYDSSLYYLKKSKAIQDSINYEFGKAETNRFLGCLYSYLSDYESASYFLYQALEVYENNKNLNEVQKTYYELGWVYYSRNIFEKAIEYLNMSITIAEKVGNLDYLGKSHNALGNVYYELGEYEQSLTNYLKSSEFIGKTNNIKAYADSKFNAAIVYDEIGMKDKALQIYNESYKINTDYNDLLGMAIGEYTLAKFYIENEAPIKSQEYITKAINRLEKLGVKNELAVAYKIASNINTEIGDFKLANYFLRAHQKLREENYLQEKNNVIDKLDARYKVHNYEQKIKLLKLEKENTANQLLVKDATIYNQQILLYVSISVFILLVLLLYITYRFLTIRSNSNRELVQLNQQIYEKQEEILAQAEELQEANEHISLINNNLENRVEERTQELIKAKTDLDLFFYKASHDFRGPLTTFMGLAEVAEISLTDKDALELFKKVKETAVRLDKMVIKLQSISLLNKENIEKLSYMSINIRELFNTISKEFEEIDLEKKVDLIFETNVNEVHFYDHYLKMIIQILLENGLIFNNNPKPFVKTIILETTSELILTVEDNGEGIPPNKQDEVFDMFHRTSTQSTGNGLGLFLLKKIVDNLNGHISLSSTVNKGSKFIIKFPNIMSLSNGSK